MDNLRRFVVVFTIITVVTLSITGFSMSLRYFDVSKGLTKNIDVEGQAIDIDINSTKKEELCENILVTVGDRYRSETLLMFILNINTRDNSMSMLFIPGDLEYTYQSEDNPDEGTVKKISGVCHEESPEKCAEILSSILDISIPCYIHFDDSAFIKFFNVFSSIEGGFDYDIPVSFVYHYNNERIAFNKGIYRFSGLDVLNFMNFYKTDDNTYKSDLIEFYDGTDKARLKMVSHLFDAFIENQFIMQKDDYYSKNFDDLFLTSVLGLCETNITGNNFKLVQDYLSALQKNAVSFYLINGEEIVNGEHYEKYMGSLLDITDNSQVEVFATEVFDVKFKSIK